MVCSLPWSKPRTIVGASNEALDLGTVRCVEVLGARDDVSTQSLAQSPHALRARLAANSHPLGDDGASDAFPDPRQELPIFGGNDCAYIAHHSNDDSRRRRGVGVSTCTHASRIFGATRRNDVFPEAVDACRDMVAQARRRG